MPHQTIYPANNTPADAEVVTVFWNKDPDDPWAGVLTHPKAEKDFDFIVKLNRRQTNDLIHVLRRARDGAWGRDE